MCKHKWIRLLGKVGNEIKPLPIYSCLKCGALKVGSKTITLTDYIDFTATTAPTAVEGRMYYDSGDKKVKIYDGTNWQSIPTVLDEEITLVLADDFADGVYATRTAFSTLPYTFSRIIPSSPYSIKVTLPSARPDWTVDSGTWDASGGFLEWESQAASLDEYIHTPSTTVTGTFKCDMRCVNPAGRSQCNPVFRFISVDTSNNYYVELAPWGGAARLSKIVAGTITVLISISWSADERWHEEKVTRDANGNFEWFHDGVSQGTVTDTDITSSSYIYLNVGTGATYTSPDTGQFDNVMVY